MGYCEKVDIILIKESFLLVPGWCGVYFYISSSKNDRKTKKIMISTDLLGLPWQHRPIYWDYHSNMGYTTGISNKFLLTTMFCLYSVSKYSKIKQTFMFSEIVVPKMGLIDPSPFVT